ncbi:MAG TPA: PH domain-containing protein [Candidatus Limnocylindria bacterium]|nr:PH domain-containing protein [Candidatus Limnocylindria bacterium]
MAKAPGDVILEPNERVILATRPLFLWEPLALLEIALVVASLYLYGRSGAGGGTGVRSPQLEWLSYLCLGVAALLLLWIVVKWIPWSRTWFVLTDRRVIATWGVLNRNQAALLLDRIQDASLTRPFPLSLIRDYGTLHLESAGEHAQERISGGLDELDMTRATAFYRALTDAQTKS